MITAYPNIVRQEGLAVEVVSGFATRSHGDFRRSPPAIVWHHDASPPGPSPGVLGWMVANWDSASANIWVDTFGKWWFVGAGVAWHAGAVLPGMPGNYEAIGIETDYTSGETISPKLYDSLRRGTAAIMRAMRQPASDLHFHKTICSPPGRKADPWGLNLAIERAAVAKHIAGTVPPLPKPDTTQPGGPGGSDPRDWFDMATEEDLRRIIAEELDQRGLNGQGINGYMANVLRAEEFDLEAQMQYERTFRAVVDVLHAEEFDLGATRRDTRDTQAIVATLGK